MTDCPICGEPLRHPRLTVCETVECFSSAVETGLIDQREVTPEEEARWEAEIAAQIKANEEHAEWLESQGR